MTERTSAYDRYAPMLDEYAGLDHEDPDRARLQAELAGAFAPVARNIAARFARRGEPVEDLEQVASIGLLNALTRYDPSRQRDFLSYAIPTMMGEVRRHFRDVTWAVRTPRGVKDRYVQVGAASASLSQKLGRAPSVSELAEHLGMNRDDVAEAYAAGGSYRPASLDRVLADSDATALIDLIGTNDPDLDHVDTRSVVGQLLSSLPERERRLLVLRFAHEQTQYEIASQLCISQMHVSRLLTKTLGLLRERLRAWEAAEPGVLAA